MWKTSSNDDGDETVSDVQCTWPMILILTLIMPQALRTSVSFRTPFYHAMSNGVPTAEGRVTGNKKDHIGCPGVTSNGAVSSPCPKERGVIRRRL